jgi:nitroreductase
VSIRPSFSRTGIPSHPRKLIATNASQSVSDAIRFKRAIRKFSPTPLPEETIFAILNDCRRAQSSKNSQPWNFIAITERAILKALSKCGDWAGHLAGSALGVALLSEDPTEKIQRLFDLGQATTHVS